MPRCFLSRHNCLFHIFNLPTTVEITQVIASLNVTSKTSTSLDITWNKLPGVNQYEVDYQLTNLGQCQSNDSSPRAGVVKTDSSSYTITDLTPYSTYTLYVTAIDDAGVQIDEGTLVATTNTGSKMLLKLRL